MLRSQGITSHSRRCGLGNFRGRLSYYSEQRMFYTMFKPRGTTTRRARMTLIFKKGTLWPSQIWLVATCEGTFWTMLVDRIIVVGTAYRRTESCFSIELTVFLIP